MSSVPFYGPPVFEVLRSQDKMLGEEVAKLAPSDLAIENEESLLDKLCKKCDVLIPQVNWEGVTVSEDIEERPIGREGAFMRDLAPGTFVEVPFISFLVPFTGDYNVLAVRPSRSNIVTGVELEHNKMRFRYAKSTRTPADMKSQFESDLKRVRENYDMLAKELAPFNESLREKARTLLEQRRDKVQTGNSFMDELGYPKHGS